MTPFVTALASLGRKPEHIAYLTKPGFAEQHEYDSNVLAEHDAGFVTLLAGFRTL